MDCPDYNIITWNIRGAMSKKGKRHVKELVRRFQPKVFIVLETHVQFSKVKSFWENLGYTAVGVLEAMRHFGGVWVLTVTL